MKYLEQMKRLNAMLLKEMPEYQTWAGKFPADITGQRRLLRSLMNLRPPMPLSRTFLNIQDKLLSAEREEKEIVDGMVLPTVGAHPQIALWQGDIT